MGNANLTGSNYREIPAVTWDGCIYATEKQNKVKINIYKEKIKVLRQTFNTLYSKIDRGHYEHCGELHKALQVNESVMYDLINNGLISIVCFSVFLFHVRNR